MLSSIRVCSPSPRGTSKSSLNKVSPSRPVSWSLHSAQYVSLSPSVSGLLPTPHSDCLDSLGYNRHLEACKLVFCSLCHVPNSLRSLKGSGEYATYRLVNIGFAVTVDCGVFGFGCFALRRTLASASLTRVDCVVGDAVCSGSG